MGYNSTNIPPYIVAALPPFLKEQVPLYDETLQPNNYVACGFCLVISYFFISLRLYGRHLTASKLGWDDYVMIGSVFVTTASISVMVYLTHLGFGRHMIVLILENLDHIDNIENFLHTNVASNALLFLALCGPRISILLFLARLFPSPNLRRAVIATTAGVIAYTLTCILVLTCTCLPVHVSLADPGTPPLSCHNLARDLIYMSSFGGLLDAITLALPMPYVWRLQTSLTRKLQLTALFLLGTFVLAIAVLRTYYFTHLDFSDATYNGLLCNLWTVVDVGLSIAVGCLPCTIPVWKHWFPTRKSKSLGGSGNSGQTPKDINLVTFGSSGKGKRMKGISVLTTTEVTRNDAELGQGSFIQLVEPLEEAHYAEAASGRQSRGW